MVVIFALAMPGLMLGATMLLWQMETRLLGDHQAEPILAPVLVPDPRGTDPVLTGNPAPKQRAHTSRPVEVAAA